MRTTPKTLLTESSQKLAEHMGTTYTSVSTFYQCPQNSSSSNSKNNNNRRLIRGSDFHPIFFTIKQITCSPLNLMNRKYNTTQHNTATPLYRTTTQHNLQCRVRESYATAHFVFSDETLCRKKNAESLKRRNELEPKQVQLSNGEELKRFYVVLLLTVLVEMPLRVCATPYK